MLRQVFDVISLWILPVIITIILLCAIKKKVPVYETFIDGAKSGIDVTLKIVPYLTAIIVVIAMFRASGAMDMITNLCSGFLNKINFPADILPLAVFRSFSGSASLGIFSDIASQNPPDSYAVKLGAIMLGSSETTFYVLSVYFGSVGIKNYRYALLAGIFADIIGIIAAVAVANVFFV